MSDPPAVQHIIDVTADLLAGNDDAPAPGRLEVVAGCAVCRTSRRWPLPRGRWAIDHTHDGTWTAHQLHREPPTGGCCTVAPDVHDAAALATGLAKAATR